MKFTPKERALKIVSGFTLLLAPCMGFLMVAGACTYGWISLISWPPLWCIAFTVHWFYDKVRTRENIIWARYWRIKMRDYDYLGEGGYYDGAHYYRHKVTGKIKEV